MTSREPFDLLSERDLPTTGSDIEALRTHRPGASDDWLAELTALAAQFRGATDPHQRRTFAGLPPFEL
jgi:hypothetical protein